MAGASSQAADGGRRRRKASQGQVSESMMAMGSDRERKRFEEDMAEINTLLRGAKRHLVLATLAFIAKDGEEKKRQDQFPPCVRLDP